MSSRDLQQINFYFDRTEPEIAEGEVLILVQDGKCEVVRFHLPGLEDYSHYFSHPANSADLQIEARDVIRCNFPGFEYWDTARVFLCPSQLVQKARWEVK